MKILIVGGGGREHALGWKLAQDPMVTEILSAPGNPGLADLGRCLPLKVTDAAGLAALAAREQVGLVVIGPEAAAEAGLADQLAQIGIPCCGPTKQAAQLETSKAFMKAFCARHKIPTADYEVFEDAIRAKAYLAEREPPYVIKVDGLAQGKGVTIAQTRREADEAIDLILFHRKFGAAGDRVIIEQYLPGEEASFFALCDGNVAIPLIAAQDHKRAFDGDKGPNTGGMGAYSPAKVFDQTTQDRVMNEIVQPTLRGMAEEGAPFVGILFAGLMLSADGPKLIEFNVRFGDPECQVLMRRLKSPLAPVLLDAARGELSDTPALEWSDESAALVVYAANGYPEDPLTGSLIRGLGEAEAVNGVTIFHAGTKRDEDGALRAAGGRVLGISATGDTLAAALTRAYAAIDAIDWPGGFCRRDIGWRAHTDAPPSEES